MMDMGVHCIDLFQYVLGTRVKEVAAFHDTLTFHYEVEDTSTVLLRMENGAQCVVQSNFNVPDDAAKWRFELFGDQGHLVGDGVIGQVDGGSLDAMFLGKQGGYDAKQDKKDGNKADIAVELGNMYAREIASFSDSILYGTPVEVPAEEAVYVQRVMEAAYRANDSGCCIRL